MHKVASIDQHPKRVQTKIREVGRQLGKVAYSMNLNDLVSARKVSMRAIWDCIEEGEIVRDHLHHEENGVYAKLRCHTGGEYIEVDVLLHPDGEKLEILYAEETEGQ